MPGSGRRWPARSSAHRSSSHQALADSSRTSLAFSSLMPRITLRTGPPYLDPSSVELRAGWLAPREIDPELFGRSEHVLVGLLHLDLLALRGENLHVQGEGLHLLDQHLERLRDPRLGDLLVHQVEELHDVDVAHRHRLLERLPSATVEEHGLPVVVDEPHPVLVWL